MDIHTYPTRYPCAYPILSHAESTLYPMHSPSISKLVIHSHPTGYPCAHPVYPMGHPLFIWHILQAYPTGYPCLSNRLSKHIKRDIPLIHLDIQLGISSDLLPGHLGWFLHCHPDLHSGTRSCIICCFRWTATMLWTRGVSNACENPTAGPLALLHPTWPLLQLPMLCSRQLPASGAPWVCDIADP